MTLARVRAAATALAMPHMLYPVAAQARPPPRGHDPTHATMATDSEASAGERSDERHHVHRLVVLRGPAVRTLRAGEVCERPFVQILHESAGGWLSANDVAVTPGEQQGLITEFRGPQ